MAKLIYMIIIKENQYKSLFYLVKLTVISVKYFSFDINPVRIFFTRFLYGNIAAKSAFHRLSMSVTGAFVINVHQIYFFENAPLYTSSVVIGNAVGRQVGNFNAYRFFARLQKFCNIQLKRNCPRCACICSFTNTFALSRTSPRSNIYCDCGSSFSKV